MMEQMKWKKGEIFCSDSSSGGSTMDSLVWEGMVLVSGFIGRW